MSNRIDDVFISLRGDTTDFERSLNNAQSQIGKLADYVAAKPMLAFAGLSLAILGVAADATNMAAQVDDALKGMTAAAPQTVASLGAIRDTLKDLSLESGRSQVELAQGATLLARAGVQSAADIQTLLRAGVTAADASGGDLNAILTSLDKAGKEFHLTANQDAQALADVFAIAQGHAPLDEVLEVLGKTGPAADKTGLSIQTMAAAIVNLVDRGLTVRQASQEINTLAKSGEDGKAQIEALGEVAGTAADRLAALERAAATSRESADALEKILKANLNAALIDLGNAILPTVIDELKGLTGLLGILNGSIRQIDLSSQVATITSLSGVIDKLDDAKRVDAIKRVFTAIQDVAGVVQDGNFGNLNASQGGADFLAALTKNINNISTTQLKAIRDGLQAIGKDLPVAQIEQYTAALALANKAIQNRPDANAPTAPPIKPPPLLDPAAQKAAADAEAKAAADRLRDMKAVAAAQSAFDVAYQKSLGEENTALLTAYATQLKQNATEAELARVEAQKSGTMTAQRETQIDLLQNAKDDLATLTLQAGQWKIIHDLSSTMPTAVDTESLAALAQAIHSNNFTLPQSTVDALTGDLHFAPAPVIPVPDAQDNAKKVSAIYKQLADEVGRTFEQTFEGITDGSITSLTQVVAQFSQMFEKMLADLLAKEVETDLFGNLTKQTGTVPNPAGGPATPAPAGAGGSPDAALAAAGIGILTFALSALQDAAAAAAAAQAKLVKDTTDFASAMQAAADSVAGAGAAISIAFAKTQTDAAALEQQALQVYEDTINAAATSGGSKAVAAIANAASEAYLAAIAKITANAAAQAAQLVADWAASIDAAFAASLPGIGSTISTITGIVTKMQTDLSTAILSGQFNKIPEIVATEANDLAIAFKGMSAAQLDAVVASGQLSGGLLDMAEAAATAQHAIEDLAATQRNNTTIGALDSRLASATSLSDPRASAEYAAAARAQAERDEMLKVEAQLQDDLAAHAGPAVIAQDNYIIALTATTQAAEDQATSLAAAAALLSTITTFTTGVTTDFIASLGAVGTELNTLTGFATKQATDLATSGSLGLGSNITDLINQTYLNNVKAFFTGLSTSDLDALLPSLTGDLYSWADAIDLAKHSTDAATQSATDLATALGIITDNVSQLSQQNTLFGTSLGDQATSLRTLLGFTGLSDDAIKGLYTKEQNGVDLTPAQKTLNDNIATYFDTETQYLASIADATTTTADAAATAGAAAPSNSVTVTSNVGETLDLVGLAETANALLAQIVGNTASLRAGGPLTPPSLAGWGVGSPTAQTTVGSVTITVGDLYVSIQAPPDTTDPTAFGTLAGRAAAQEINQQLGLIQARSLYNGGANRSVI